VPSLIDEKMPCFERSVYREILRNVKARQNAEQIDSFGVTHFSKLLGLRQVSMPNCQTNKYKSIHLAAMVADLHAIRFMWCIDCAARALGYSTARRKD